MFTIKCNSFRELTKAIRYRNLIARLHKETNPSKSILGLAIKTAIKNKREPVDIFKTIQSQVEDNRTAMEGIISKELTEEICNLKLS